MISLVTFYSRPLLDENSNGSLLQLRVDKPKVATKYSVHVNMTPLGAAPQRSLRKAYPWRYILKDLEEQHR